MRQKDYLDGELQGLFDKKPIYTRAYLPYDYINGLVGAGMVNDHTQKYFANPCNSSPTPDVILRRLDINNMKYYEIA